MAEQQTPEQIIETPVIEIAKLPPKKRGPRLKQDLSPEIIAGILEDSLVKNMKYLELSIKYCLSYQQIKNIEAKYGQSYRDKVLARAEVKVFEDYLDKKQTDKQPDKQ